MSNEVLREIMEKIEHLTTDQQLRLIGMLSEMARAPKGVADASRLKWSDLPGILECPACGEDAQEYISRSRREDDAKRLGDLNR